MGNLLDMDINNRFLVPNDTVINIINNNPDFREKVEQAGEKNKINLLTFENKQKNSVQEYLQELAKKSFDIECSLYDEMDIEYSNAVRTAWGDGKNPLYLKKQYKQNISLGQGLTNLFYGGKGESTDTTLTTLLQDLGHLDAHQLIEMTSISNEKIIANIIVSKIDEMMRGMQREKNIAFELDKSTGEIFKELFNEKNFMSYIEDLKITDTEAKKVISSLLEKEKKSPEFNLLSSADKRNKMASMIAESKISISQIWDFLLDSTIDEMWKGIAPYTIKGYGKKKFANDILALLRSGKIGKMKKGETLEEFAAQGQGFAFKSAGASKNETTFQLAAYRLNTDKILINFSDKIIHKQQKENNSIDIKNYNLGDLDDAVINALQEYNNALQNYLKAKGHTEAWDYYEKNFLQEVINLAKRDYETEKEGKDISNLTSEIQKGVNSLQIAHSINEILKQVEEVSSSLDTSLSSQEINSILEMAAQFLNNDKKDLKVLNSIKELVKNKSTIQQGMKDLKDRLTSKRAGYIANFNGSIGEIFITAIISVVFKGKIDNVYQKGSSTNIRGQSAHADITMDNIGIQSKVYQTNDIKLYEDTVVTFESDDALRYLRTRLSNSKNAELDDELTSFRFFLLNNAILKDIQSDYYADNNFFLKALYLRLENFIRYSDGLTKLGNIKNNFYLINFNIVPASVIFLKMAEMFQDEDYDKKSLIIFENKVNDIQLKSYQGESDNDYLLTNNNLLSLLNKSNAKFKSFVLKLSDLGLETF